MKNDVETTKHAMIEAVKLEYTEWVECYNNVINPYVITKQIPTGYDSHIVDCMLRRIESAALRSGDQSLSNSADELRHRYCLVNSGRFDLIGKN